MNRVQAYIRFILALSYLFSSVFALSALAQSGGGFVINPWAIPGGGRASAGSNLRVEGSLGQHSVATSSGSSFTINAGFWPSAVPCLALSQSSQSFAASGGTGSLQVLAVAACAWTATSDNPDFLTVTSGLSGSGFGTVTYSVAAHSDTARRIGTITIANQTFTVYQGIAFQDVPPGSPFYIEIGKLSARAVSLGCGAGFYCPEQLVTRQQMAAFLMRARGEFNPPAPPLQRFNDVPPTNPFYHFIDRMAILQITQGCSAIPPLYCPSAAVSREQMAAFIIRALQEPGYIPPAPAGQRFQDVAASNPFYGHIEEMAVRGITLGCSANPPLYCPSQSVTRGQMAAFLVRAFGL